MQSNPLTLKPKPNAHREAILKLMCQHPELAATGMRKLYTYYLDICPEFISEETFNRKLAKIKSEMTD